MRIGSYNDLGWPADRPTTALHTPEICVFCLNDFNRLLTHKSSFRHQLRAQHDLHLKISSKASSELNGK